MAARGNKSRKRSGANFRRSKLPEPFVFFLDQCIGNKLVAEVLRSHGCGAELLSDHFPDSARDDEWLPAVGKKGWVVIGKDKRLRRRPNELAALVKGGVRAFILTSGNMRGVEMAEAVRKALPAMKQYVRDYEPPFVATISAKGQVQLLLRASDVQHKARK